MNKGKIFLGLALTGVAALSVAIPTYCIIGSPSQKTYVLSPVSKNSSGEEKYGLKVKSAVRGKSGREFRAELNTFESVLGGLEVFVLCPDQIGYFEINNTFLDNFEERKRVTKSVETKPVSNAIPHLDRNTKSISYKGKSMEVPAFAFDPKMPYSVRRFEDVSVSRSSGDKWILETTFDSPPKDAQVRFYLYPSRSNGKFRVQLVENSEPIIIDAKIHGK